MGVMLSYAIFVMALPEPKMTVCSTTHATYGQRLFAMLSMGCLLSGVQRR